MQRAMKTSVAPTSAANDFKSKVKRAIKDSGENICISFNIGASCPRPLSMTGCIFRRAGMNVDLAHTCAFVLPTGARCKMGHSWKGNH